MSGNWIGSEVRKESSSHECWQVFESETFVPSPESQVWVPIFYYFIFKKLFSLYKQPPPLAFLCVSMEMEASKYCYTTVSAWHSAWNLLRCLLKVSPRFHTMASKFYQLPALLFTPSSRVPFLNWPFLLPIFDLSLFTSQTSFSALGLYSVLQPMTQLPPNDLFTFKSHGQKPLLKEKKGGTSNCQSPWLMPALVSPIQQFPPLAMFRWSPSFQHNQHGYNCLLANTEWRI